MRVRGVELPEPLLTALPEDRLVVFAGAGVSQGAPSNLPNFRGLTDRIAEGTAQTRIADEPDEVFLGRLEQQGVRVHERGARVVLDPASLPTQLHQDLLQLFHAPEQIRLVTTNFDEHFDTAARQTFDRSPAVYRAPALPLGDDFSGIVYVHGSASGGNLSLVLTDSDFGRAYLTQGWARRFLLAMFSKFVVLFVGYSHNDTVLKYLARGLPPASEARRYALVREGGDLEHWRFLGIEPLTYPPDEHGEHSRLQVAIHRWAEIAGQGALDAENYIRAIVSAPPSHDEDEDSYLDQAVRDLVKARFFTRHAGSREWLHWLDSKRILDPLFLQGETDDRDREFAGWVANRFAVDYLEDVLALIERHRQGMHPDLWWRTVDALAYSQRDLSSDVLSRWVPVLIAYAPMQRRLGLEEVLLLCLRSGAYAATIELLDHLTSPRVALRRHIIVPGHDDRRQTEAEVVFPETFDLLRGRWREVCGPHMSRLAQPLLTALTRNLESAYRLVEASGRASPHWDPLSYFRSAIEPHPQGEYRGDYDFVVDMLRDVLEWTIAQDPAAARPWIELWSSADPPILRRLALHGLHLDPGVPPNEKLELVIRKEWLYAPGLKHEVFLLLHDAYGSADPQVRQSLIEYALSRTAPETADEERRNTVEYEKYNVLIWLTRAAPECELARAAVERLKTNHPEFQPREHPDLDHWTEGGWVGHESPLTIEGLLARPPQEQLDFLLSYRGNFFEGPSRDGLLEQITEACKSDFTWSQSLAASLIERRAWSSDIWRYIVRGWSSAPLVESQWEVVLGILNDHELLAEQNSVIADLLERAVTDEAPNPLPPSLYGLADGLALVAWRSLGRPAAGADAEDWLFRAINDPAGKLALFWLRCLSRIRRGRTSDRPPLAEPYRQRFTVIASDETQPGELGRVVLASQLGFLFAVDQEWAREKLLPLFDWDRDRRHARQAWAGFLVWGRWSEALLGDLMPHYQRLFLCQASDLTSAEWRQVAHHVAEIAVYGISDPLREWLPHFLRFTRIEQRVDFSSHLWYLLHHMRPEIKSQVWTRWLMRYWQQRNHGVPLPWDVREAKQMAEWVVELEAQFDEAVNVFVAGPAPVVDHTILFHRLGETRLPEGHPESLGSFLLHFLAVQERLSYHACNEIASLVRRMIAAGTSRQAVQAVCEQLGRLGCPDAVGLRNSVPEG